MARKRTKLALSPSDIAQVKRRLGSTRNPGDKKRLRVVLWAASGLHTLAELAQKARCARSSIQRWLKLFAKLGLDGWLVHKLPVRRISAMARRQVRKELLAGQRTGRWRTAEQVAAWLKAEHGIRMKVKSVCYQLRKIGFVFRRLRRPISKQKTGCKANVRRKLRGEGWRGQPAEVILAHDLGTLAACLVEEPGARIYIGKRPEFSEMVTQVDLYLEEFYHSLGQGECSLVAANQFVTALLEEWEREQFPK